MDPRGHDFHLVCKIKSFGILWGIPWDPFLQILMPSSTPLQVSWCTFVCSHPSFIAAYLLDFAAPPIVAAIPPVSERLSYSRHLVILRAVSASA